MNQSKQRLTPRARLLILLITAAAIIAIYLIFIRPALMPTMATTGLQLILFFAVFIAFVVILAALLIVLVTVIVRAMFMHGKEQNKVWHKRLRFFAVRAALAGAALAVLVLASQGLAYTPPIRDAAGNKVPGSIAVLEQVELNGSSQWITIRGMDQEKPVLLFLAGGPGGSQLAAARDQLSALESHFVVVGWDQPGSGKSYHAMPQSQLNRQRYIDDGLALAKHLCERFGKQKIYLVGESWGSALGVWMVQQQPELFSAFVGTGQMVSFLDTENECYALAMKIAKERGDTQVVQNLTLQGPPPYYGDGVALKMGAYLMYLFNVMSSNPQIAPSSHNTFTDLAGTEYGLYDKLTYILGMTDTLGFVYQQLYDLDLREHATKLEVPVYFFEGRYDINAPTHFVEDYHALLSAPHKQIVWFEHSGHSPWIEERELFVQTLVNVLQE